MNLKSRFQLSTMMFFQYFIWSAWYVTMSTFLSKGLGCDDTQVGYAYGFTAFAFIISPIFTGLVADKFFDSEKILGVLHLVGAGVLYIMSLSSSFDSFFPLMVLYMLMYAPTIALTSSIAMQQIDNPEKDFPSIRVLGTIGWIAAGLYIGYGNFDFANGFALKGFDETSSTPFLIASFASAFLGLFSFSLPKVAPKDKGGKVDIKSLLGLDAIGLMKNASFRMLIISIFLIYIPMTFYFQFGSVFLTEIGITKSAALQTLGQVSEVGFMLILPFVLGRIGIKPMLIVGMAAWVLRYVFYGYADGEENLWMVFVAIGLHGVCYDFLFVSSQIYVDKKAPENLRSSAQALMTTATYGIGMFLGANIAGAIAKSYTNPDTLLHDWNPIWLIASTMVAVVVVIFAVFFKDDTKKQEA